jgi:hypothetical protein
MTASSTSPTDTTSSTTALPITAATMPKSVVRKMESSATPVSTTVNDIVVHVSESSSTTTTTTTTSKTTTTTTTTATRSAASLNSFSSSETRGQTYKTFYSRYLLTFVIS